MQARAVCTKILFCAGLGLLLPSSGYADGLSREAVEAYYTEMVKMNSELKEGFEDLERFVSFLDENLSDDFQHQASTYIQCAKEPVEVTTLDKESLIDIYKQVGVDNFESYKIDMQSIDISDDAMNADVSYVISISDPGKGEAFHVKCLGRAHHVWDPARQRTVIKSQSCEEHVTIGTAPDSCVAQ